MESDVSLVLRSVKEPGAFEELVGRHGGRVHAYLYRRAPQEADDLLAETWLAAFAARASYHPDRGPFVAWLFGIARHVLFAWFRRQGQGSRGDESEQFIRLRPDEEVHDDWGAVDDRLDAAHMEPKLRAAVAALPAAEREVLLLVAWEQLTPTEIAGAIGVPAGTVRSRLHRARHALAAAVTPLSATRCESSTGTNSTIPGVSTPPSLEVAR